MPESVTELSIVYVEGLVFACGAEAVVGGTAKVGGITISKVRCPLNGYDFILHGMGCAYRYVYMHTLYRTVHPHL